MKPLAKLLSFAAILLITAQASPAFAATKLTGCAAKRDSLTRQIQQSDGDPQRRLSLEKALDEVNAHCTDSELARERNRKIISAQGKVNEAQRALDKAKSQHRSEDKIQKLQDKYDAAKKKLADAQAELKR